MNSHPVNFEFLAFFFSEEKMKSHLQYPNCVMALSMLDVSRNTEQRFKSNLLQYILSSLIIHTYSSSKKMSNDPQMLCGSCMFLYILVCLSVCLCVCLSVCLSVWILDCLPICCLLQHHN